MNSGKHDVKVDATPERRRPVGLNHRDLDRFRLAGDVSVPKADEPSALRQMAAAPTTAAEKAPKGLGLRQSSGALGLTQNIGNRETSWTAVVPSTASSVGRSFVSPATTPGAQRTARPATRLINARTGFTLIEMIGVLAVLAILASLAVPPFVRRIDQAARVRDAAELNGMAVALRSYTLRTGQIPNQGAIVSALASEMAVSATQIATSSRNVPRAFMVDPNLWIASGLPYSPEQHDKRDRNQRQRRRNTGNQSAHDDRFKPRSGASGNH